MTNDPIQTAIDALEKATQDDNYFEGLLLDKKQRIEYAKQALEALRALQEPCLLKNAENEKQTDLSCEDERQERQNAEKERTRHCSTKGAPVGLSERQGVDKAQTVINELAVVVVDFLGEAPNSIEYFDWPELQKIVEQAEEALERNKQWIGGE